MLADISEKLDALAEVCRRYGVSRLEVFGSAARDDFDPARSDADFLVTFQPAARNDLEAFSDLKEALEKLFERPVDLVERETIETSRNFIRRRAILKEAGRSMADLPERDAALLLDMLLAARDAKAFIEGLDEAAFFASRLHQNAVIRSLEVLGEAAGRVSAATRAGHPEIPWREITGMRHRLIHGYGEVRLDLVWTVLRDRLGPLTITLAGLVPGDNDGSP